MEKVVITTKGVKSEETREIEFELDKISEIIRESDTLTIEWSTGGLSDYKNAKIDRITL